MNIGVVAVDVDHFKAINDTYGHERGDAVLRELADRLSAAVRVGDLLYRTGGEEFVVLAPGAGAPECMMIAERLCAAVRASAVAGLAVTVSAGVHSDTPAHADLSVMLRCADKALYDAKRAGRDRVGS